MQATTTASPGKRERTRTAIVNAAITLIAEKGLESSSIDDLMATAGMARGTFYNYFQCRDDVLHAVSREIQQTLICEVVEFIPAELPAEHIVACMLFGYVQFCHDARHIGATLLRIGGFSPWVKADEEPHSGFARIDNALLQLCGDRVSFTSARIYMEGMSNNSLCHLLAGRVAEDHVKELLGLTLRGLGVGDKAINQAVSVASEFAGTIATHRPL